MPHPVYGRPEHRLESVEVKLILPSDRTGRVCILEAHGRSSTSRSALWSFRETWTTEEQRRSLEPTDCAHWVILAAAQDRPSSQDMFDRCTMPGGWEDVPLPF